jgi:hypothetical protein
VAEQIRATSASPRDTLLRIFAHMASVGAGPSYRGCPFVNVAAEYPDPDHPVRRVVAGYRGWLRDLFTGQDEEILMPLSYAGHLP